jgi:phosphoribosylamine--glycine ligase
MKVMVLGSGGREHAISWKLSKSDIVEKVYVVPGNGGTTREEKCENVNLKSDEEILKFALKNRIDYTVVGPEKFLVDGIVNDFEKNNLKIFGPDRRAAMLEGSKVWAREFQKKYGVKIPEYTIFEDYDEASHFLSTVNFPKVIKADGLAKGKGVYIVNNFQDSLEVIKRLMKEKSLGEAGKKIVVEDYIEGHEASIIAVTDGKTIVPFQSAMDYKKIYDDDKGPNTGGMGSISPNPYFTNEVFENFKKDIMEPTLKGIIKEKLNYKGIIYFGIMISNGKTYLLEYNVRFGDPETQALLPLMETDLMEVILKTLKGELDEVKIKWKEESSCCVILASNGYPGSYETGFEIKGLENCKSKIFHNATKDDSGTFLTNGGRVLSVVGMDKDPKKAVKKAYTGVNDIKFANIYCRKDIGKDYL